MGAVGFAYQGQQQQQYSTQYQATPSAQGGLPTSMHAKLQAAQAQARLIQQQQQAAQMAAATSGDSGQPAAKQAKRNRWDK